MDVWSEMAKEVKQNFGNNGIKTVPRVNGSNAGSGNSDSNDDVKVSEPQRQHDMSKRNILTSGHPCDMKKSSKNVSSPQESGFDKHFSTDSNSSGVQSNSYSDLSDNGGCMIDAGANPSSPEGAHKNLVEHVTRGVCSSEIRSGSSTKASVPGYPPPCYNSLEDSVVKSAQFSSFLANSQPVSAVQTPLITNHRFRLNTGAMPDDLRRSHNAMSTSKYCASKQIPIAMSSARLLDDKSGGGEMKMGEVKEYQMRTFQPPVTGMYPIMADSPYNLRPSVSTTDVPMRPNRISLQADGHITDSNSCRYRYSPGYPNKS